jgi:hypothetical protein
VEYGAAANATTEVSAPWSLFPEGVWDRRLRSPAEWLRDPSRTATFFFFFPGWYICMYIRIYLSISIYLAVLAFELRASCLPAGAVPLESHHQSCFILGFFEIGSSNPDPPALWLPSS